MDHKIIIGKSQKMDQITAESVALVVTSPPYPMIEMWDEIMANQNSAIRTSINAQNGQHTFELMHQELDQVWAEISRVIIPGGFVCINIGDATRSINGDFALYPNHSRIISAFHKLGFSNLPGIIWRKQTNAPNKFMGSGMLPSGAYVTLEHEWILVFRKGGKRQFKTDIEKLNRKKSSFFWEERNVWFSDVWDLKGVKQKVQVKNTRERSAAFPFEIPYRLINMYSIKGDTVLDPFVGTGTTILAAIASERNSTGIEIDKSFSEIIINNINTSVTHLNSIIYSRVDQHSHFVSQRSKEAGKNKMKHFNIYFKMPVMTSAESEMTLAEISRIEMIDNYTFKSSYKIIETETNSIEHTINNVDNVWRFEVA